MVRFVRFLATLSSCLQILANKEKQRCSIVVKLKLGKIQKLQRKLFFIILINYLLDNRNEICYDRFCGREVNSSMIILPCCCFYNKLLEKNVYNQKNYLVAMLPTYTFFGVFKDNDE